MYKYKFIYIYIYIYKTFETLKVLNRKTALSGLVLDQS